LPLSEEATGAAEPASSRRRKYASMSDVLIALWDASDRVCSKPRSVRPRLSLDVCVHQVLDRHENLHPLNPLFAMARRMQSSRCLESESQIHH
jgi:hypothetical protein